MTEDAATRDANQEANTLREFKPKRLSFVKIQDTNEKHLRHAHLEYVSGKNAPIHDMDFSYATIYRGYFHGADFRRCRFTGTRFDQCNFRNSTFTDCDFRYSELIGTRIPTKEIMENLPPEPNIRRELLQTLRANAEGLGDREASREFVLEEIRAKQEHLRRAWRPQESYYREKYGGFKKQIVVGYNRIRLALGGFLWGHGERLWMIAVSTAAMILLFTAIAVSSWIAHHGSGVSLAETAQAAARELTFFLGVFLDVPVSRTEPRPAALEWILVAWRYVAWGVLVAAMFRILSHR